MFLNLASFHKLLRNTMLFFSLLLVNKEVMVLLARSRKMKLSMNVVRTNLWLPVYGRHRDA